MKLAIFILAIGCASCALLFYANYIRDNWYNKIKVNVKRLSNDAIVPTRGSDEAAGFDLYACIESEKAVTIDPHKTALIGTGVAIEIPKGYFGAVYARSGIASKRGLRPANCVGVIDSDYRGEIMVSLHNDTDTQQIIDANERIAQIVLIPYLRDADMTEVGRLSKTKRGSGGFGSTGAK